MDSCRMCGEILPATRMYEHYCSGLCLCKWNEIQARERLAAKLSANYLPYKED